MYEREEYEERQDDNSKRVSTVEYKECMVESIRVRLKKLEVEKKGIGWWSVYEYGREYVRVPSGSNLGGGWYWFVYVKSGR